MKHLITIVDQNNVTIYKGRLINMPMKPSAIKEKCIELFNDDDPCIIHQSYASAKFAEIFLELFERKSVERRNLKDHANALDFVDIANLSECLLTLEVKK